MLLRACHNAPHTRITAHSTLHSISPTPHRHLTDTIMMTSSPFSSPSSTAPTMSSVRRETMTTHDATRLILGTTHDSWVPYHFETPCAPMKAPRVVSWDETVREHGVDGHIVPRTLFPPPGFKKAAPLTKNTIIIRSQYPPYSYDSPPPKRCLLNVDTPLVQTGSAQLYRPESPIGPLLQSSPPVVFSFIGK